MQTFIVLGFYLRIFEQKKVEFKRKTNTIENRFDRYDLMRNTSRGAVKGHNWLIDFNT